MSENELYETFEQMRNELGADTLLDELYRAMSDDEIESNLQYIARMWDMEVFKDEETKETYAEMLTRTNLW